MPDLDRLIVRTCTEPGDIVIRVDNGGVVGPLLSKLTSSQFVHGGLAVGGNELVEVNGGLNPDSTGRGRILANIYKTNLTTDLRDKDYVVYRCNDTDLAEQVAIEASPFAAVGYDKTWGYNLTGAIASLMEPSTKLPSGQVQYIDENESVLAVAQKEDRKFFCTEWVVWMYEKTAEKMRKYFSMGIQSKQAYPGALVEALDRCSSFHYLGAMRNNVRTTTYGTFRLP